MFSLGIDFKALYIKDGEGLEYYFVVKDNDAVNGPKKHCKKCFLDLHLKNNLKNWIK